MKQISLVFVLLVFASVNTIYGFDYVLGTTNYPYSTQTQPAKNNSYVDSTYHTTITKVSDKAVDAYSGARLITGYSTFSGISSDGKYIVLMMCDASAKYALYNSSTNAYIKDLGLQSWNGDPEPRWDGSLDGSLAPAHPSWLYYVRGTKLMRMDVDNADPLGNSVTVRDFAGIANVTYIKNDEEGDSSADSRYWVFETRDSAWAITGIVTYDKQTDSILGTMLKASFPSGVDINCVSMSPNGQYVLIDWQWTTHGTNAGPKVYNKDLTLANPNEVKNDSTHWCWATMENGNTAVVSQNNGTMYGGTQKAADVMQVYDVVASSRHYVLYMSDMGWDAGFHFFNTGKPGWAGMYTYTDSYTHTFWDYDQIYLIELKDNGRIFRVTFSQHNKVGGDYFDEGHAQMDWHLTGTKLWFNSNWRGTDNAEVYRVDLPQHWYEDLSGGTYTDSTPPYTSGHSPAKGAIGVAISSRTISYQVIDDSSGVDISSLVMVVNGATVYNGASPASYPNTVVTGTSMAYTVAYTTPSNFNYSEQINVSINASDLSANVMPQDAYSFTITGSAVIAAPSALTATAVSSATVNLQWTDNSNNETGFKIESRTDLTSYSQITVAGAGVTGYSNTGLNPGVTYYYRVRAANATDNSSYSNVASTVTYPAPAAAVFNAPSNLAAVAVSSCAISISWTDNSSIESGFQVWRKRTGSYSNIATVGPNITTYLNNTNLLAATTYFYEVRAVTGAVNSAYSNIASTVTFPALFLKAPTNLLAVAVSSGSVSLSWQDTSFAETGAKIERKLGVSGTYAQVNTVASKVTAYTDTGLSAATTYYYRVKTYFSNTDSSYSNEAAVVTDVNNEVAVEININNKISSGEIIVIGSTKNRGVVNPDQGDTAKIYFKGSEAGKYDCRIFNLSGALVWQKTLDNVSNGMFEWIPRDIASGGYVVSIIGPRMNARKKIAILR